MKQTFKYYIYQRQGVTSTPYIFLSNVEYPDIDDDRILISEHEVEHDIPDGAKQTENAITLLERKRETMRATSGAAISEVEEQIQSLKALENLS